MKPFLTLGLFLGILSSAGAQPWQGFTALALAPDGRTFATGGREGEVLWWETSTGEPLGRWVLPFGQPVEKLFFDKDATVVTGIVLDGTASIVSLGTGSLMPPTPSVPKAAPVPARSVSSPVTVVSGDLWVQGTSDGRITVRQTVSGPILATWQAHGAAVTGLALAPDGSFLLSCSYDGGLARWDPRSGKPLGRL